MDSRYRELVIKEVRRQKDGVIDVTFHDSCAGLLMAAAWLKERGIDSEELIPGCSVLIKGKRGNGDVLLAGPDALADIILMSAPTPANKNEGIRTVIGKDGGRGTMILG